MAGDDGGFSNGVTFWAEREMFWNTDYTNHHWDARNHRTLKMRIGVDPSPVEVWAGTGWRRHTDRPQCGRLSRGAMHPTLPLGLRRLPIEIDPFAPDEAETFQPWQEDDILDTDALDEIYGLLEPV